MIKKNGITTEAGIAMNCGSCVYHTQSALFAKPCSELGVEEYAIAPKCFKPNVHQLVQYTDPDFLSGLGRTCASLDPDTVRLVAYTLSNIAQMQDLGLKFGQPVYFSLGRDYIAHYFKGFLIACTEDGIVTLSSKLNNAKQATTVVMARKDILTKPEWREHIASLVNRGRLHVPDEHKPKYKKMLPEILKYDGTLDIDIDQIKKQVAAEALYEPPTIDMAPDDLIERHRKIQEADGQKTGKNRRRQKPKPPGFDISTRIEGGVKVFEIGKNNEEIEVVEEVTAGDE